MNRRAGTGHDDTTERMRTAMDEKVFLSVADVAKRLSLGVTYTRRLINSGAIRSVRIGKRVLVPRQCLDEYVSTLMGVK